MPRPIEYSQNIRPILAAVSAVPVPTRDVQEAQRGVQPFITLSREPGAGAWTFAQQLVEALNSTQNGGRPWTCWGRELMEKVAADQHIHTPLMNSLEESSHSWLDDLFGSLSLADDATWADEARLYTKVAGTVRALAQAGRTVIVGAGGVFITRHMPGGIQVRLVAPLHDRIEQMARYSQITKDEAAARIRQLEKNRQAFFKRYFPKELISPETFTATLNTARISPSAMIDIFRALIRQVEAAHANT